MSIISRSSTNAYGHPQGDKLLKLVSEAIKESIRQSDVVARYGGEGFAVFLVETPLPEGNRVGMTNPEEDQRAGARSDPIPHRRRWHLRDGQYRSGRLSGRRRDGGGSRLSGRSDVVQGEREGPEPGLHNDAGRRFPGIEGSPVKRAPPFFIQHREGSRASPRTEYASGKTVLRGISPTAGANPPSES